jgi:hypothetical protein
MPNGVTAGSRSDTSRPGLKQIFGCRFEKLRPCGAVQPRPKILRLEKHRHAVVNAAGELVGCGHDQRAAALTVVVLDVTTKASVATAGDFFDVIIDCTGDQAAMQRDFGFVGARRALRIGQRGSRNVTFSDPEFHKREIRQGKAQPDDFAEMLRQMQAERVPTRGLHTHTGPLALARNFSAAGCALRRASSRRCWRSDADDRAPRSEL